MIYQRWETDSGPSHPPIRARANAKDGETQTCSPCALQCWGHEKVSGKRLHIHPNSDKRANSELISGLSIPFTLLLVLVFLLCTGSQPQMQPSCVPAHPSCHPPTTACLSHASPARCPTRECARSHTSAAPVTLQLIAARKRPW